jgi:hypothetical protein
MDFSWNRDVHDSYPDVPILSIDLYGDIFLEKFRDAE